jgi:hypothetical protein
VVGELDEPGSNWLNKGVGKHHGGSLVPQVVLVGEERDWRGLATVRARRRSSGQARGRRPLRLSFSLLAEAMEEEEWVDGHRRGRGSLNRQEEGGVISPKARQGGPWRRRRYASLAWLDAATRLESVEAFNAEGTRQKLGDAPHGHCASTGRTGRR